MAARIALSSATLRAADSTVLQTKVTVLGDNANTVTVSRSGNALLTLPGSTVTRYSANQFQVVAGDGTVYYVDIDRSGCGCGK